MSEIALQVGGRSYRVTCADGEESHLRKLAGMVDAKLASLGSNAGVGEAQGLLFAALFLADEVEEAHRMGGGSAPAPSGVLSPGALEQIAERLEALAHALENPRPSA